MTRLCGCRPDIDYKPVQWAMREWPKNGPPRVRETAEAETTVTAFEGLPENVRGVLTLLNATCWYQFPAQMWTFRIEWKGHLQDLVWEPNQHYGIRDFLAYFMDHDHAPSLTLIWRDQ